MAETGGIIGLVFAIVIIFISALVVIPLIGNATGATGSIVGIYQIILFGVGVGIVGSAIYSFLRE